MQFVAMFSLWVVRAMMVCFWLFVLLSLAFIVSGEDALKPYIGFLVHNLSWWVIVPYAICAGIILSCHHCIKPSKKRLWGVESCKFIAVVLGLLVVFREHPSGVEPLEAIMISGGLATMLLAFAVSHFTVRPAMHEIYMDTYVYPLLEEVKMRKSAKLFDEDKLLGMTYLELETFNAQLKRLEK